MQRHVHISPPSKCAESHLVSELSNNSLPLYIVVSQKQLDGEFGEGNKYYVTLGKYVSRSNVLKQDIRNASGGLTVYGYEQDDEFKKAVVIFQNDGRKLGVRLARHSQGVNDLNESNYGSEQNGISVVLPDEYGVSEINQMLFGFHLANYKWHYKSVKQTKETGLKGTWYPVQHITIVSKLTSEAFQECVEGNWVEKVRQCLPQHILNLRQLVPTRANVATTSFMLEHVKQLKDGLGEGVNLTLIVGDQLLENGLRLLHAVGRASMYAPFMATLEYRGNPDNKNYLALIGKGVVFDTGGLSLKGTTSMETMYDDKTGACTVLEAFSAMVKLKLPLNIVCTVAVVENSVGSDSYRVSDIIQSYKGLTVEILNTDAEGRLILADAMSYTQDKYKVQLMIELSTLTGAMKSSIGNDLAGLFTNEINLVKKMNGVSELTQEQFWHLPLNDEHRNSMKGAQADLNNAGGKTGGSCAAAFLENFVEKGVKWMHWDIASVALTTSDSGIYNKGATGFGLQQLGYHQIQYINLIVYFACVKAKLIQLPKKIKKQKHKQLEQQQQ